MGRIIAPPGILGTHGQNALDPPGTFGKARQEATNAVAAYIQWPTAAMLLDELDSALEIQLAPIAPAIATAS